MRAVTLYVTGRCNLRCSHCAVGPDQEDPREELDTSQLKAVLSRLADGGARFATILGGEATMYRRDLAELLDHAHLVGLAVSINTNATVYRVLEPLLAKPALQSLVVSLDGARPETHDAMRGPRTFRRTTDTLRRVVTHPRAMDGSLGLELSYVISKANWRDAGEMVVLASELGARQLNAKHVKLTGRALDNVSELELTSAELLEAYSTMIVTWLLSGRKVALDVHVPPALAYYLNTRFGLDYPIDDHPACGGIGEFGYVDLTGNYLPCPGLSLEEDPEFGLADHLPEVNLLDRAVDGIQGTELFTEFEERRQNKAYTQQIFPCKVCRFNHLTRPCTVDLVRGKEEMEVDICRAVFESGDEHVPGLRDYVFPDAAVLGEHQR